MLFCCGSAFPYSSLLNYSQSIYALCHFCCSYPYLLCCFYWGIFFCLFPFFPTFLTSPMTLTLRIYSGHLVFFSFLFSFMYVSYFFLSSLLSRSSRSSQIFNCRLVYLALYLKATCEWIILYLSFCVCAPHSICF